MNSEEQVGEAALDTQSRAFLEGGRTSGAPNLEDMPVCEARARLRELMLSLDVERRDVARLEEAVIAAPDGSIPLRIYRPAASAQEIRPILLFFHGGAWVLGDLDSYDNTCRFLCVEGDVIVVSVGYRLAPEHRFPSALEDCYAALQWAARNALALGGDPARVGVAGDSAGGNLAAAIALRSRSAGPPVTRQILVYPVLSLLDDAPYGSRLQFGDGDYFISRTSIAWSIRLYLRTSDQALMPQASPILEPHMEGAPAALIVTAGYDPLRDEGRLYADRLLQAGVPVTYRCYRSTIHGFMAFSGAIHVGLDALRFVAAWMREQL